jgi:hypothetical protein
MNDSTRRAYNYVLLILTAGMILIFIVNFIIISNVTFPFIQLKVVALFMGLSCLFGSYVLLDEIDDLKIKYGKRSLLVFISRLFFVLANCTFPVIIYLLCVQI